MRRYINIRVPTKVEYAITMHIHANPVFKPAHRNIEHFVN